MLWLAERIAGPPIAVRSSGMSDWSFEFAGWLLFVCSALAFIATSLRSGDGLGLAGGVLFLMACLAFLVPLMRQRPKADD